MSKLIKQCRLGSPHSETGKSFMMKYSLSSYYDKNAPAIFYGLWSLNSLKKHNSLAIIVWRGSDILKCLKELPSLKKNKNIKNVAISCFIEDDLKRAGLKYKFIPIVSKDLSDFKPVPLGDEIYTYIPNHNPKYYLRYGQDIFDKVKKKCKYKINITRNSKQFSKKELIKIYERCFCGFRFTRHDGIPNQVAEMSSMGRKSFYNGNLPGSIKWTSDVEKILEDIEKQAKFIGSVNKDISIKMKNYENINRNWLKIKFWK